MKFDFLSDVGQVRQNNEDVAWSGINQYNNFAGVICDGLGGYKGGSTASGIMVDIFRERFNEIDLNYLTREQIVEWIINVINAARERIALKVVDDVQLKNMATTFVCCIIVNSKAYIFNVGDSRCWYISKDRYYQITEDQNLYNYLVKVKAGPEYFQMHRDNLFAITQFVGSMNNKSVTPDVYEIDVEPNSFFVLTSDGCHNFIELNDMVRYVFENQNNFSNACNSIIAKALSNNSNDNLSIVIMGL